MVDASGKKLKPGVGLDIGSHTVKIVEVAEGKTGREIVRFAIEEIPKNGDREGNRDEAIIQLLREMRRKYRIRENRAYLSVSGHNVITRTVLLPKMPEEEITDAVKWDAREEILFPMDDAVVDYHILGESFQQGAVSDEILSVIARDEIVSRLVLIAQQAGFKVLGVTPLPLALWDYDQNISVPSPDAATCIIDLGAERTRVYFASGRELLFNREIPNGGNSITAALEGVYQNAAGEMTELDWTEAEDIKKQVGLPAEGTGVETDRRILTSDLRERLIPAMTKQIGEIEQSIEYFISTYQFNSVDRIVLCGGGSALKGYFERISESFDTPVERCNPLMQMNAPVDDLRQDLVFNQGPALTAAAGLALGRCDKINILPDRFRSNWKKSLAAMARNSIVPAFVILLLIVSFFMRGHLREKEKTLQDQRVVLERLKGVVAQIEGPKNQLRELEEEKERLEKIVRILPKGGEGIVNIPEIMKNLARMVSWNTSLELVSFSEQAVMLDTETPEIQAETEIPETSFIIKGTIFGNKAEVLATLERFLKRLKRSALFDEVKLLDSRVTDKEKYTRRGLDFSIYVHPKNFKNTRTKL